MLERPATSTRRLAGGVALAVLLLGAAHAPATAQDAWPDSAFLAQFVWRPIGPANMSGRVTDVEGVPGTPVFYVATAAGGIWKTANSGITFRPLFTEERVVAMGDIAVAPSDTSIVWAGTGEEDSRNSISPGGGVYKSTDGGLTWQLMGLENTQAIGRIVIHPTDPNTVYVAALGHIWGANDERGLYRTTDGGETWERIHYISDRAGFVDLAMHPTDPDVLYASSWERVRGPYFLQSGGPGSGLWRSTDGGDTWTEVEGGGFPETEKGRIGIAISRSNPEIIYALVEAADPAASEGETDAGGGDEETGHGSGLYRSEDGGRTWAFMNDQNTRPFYYSQVRVDPSDPDVVIWSSTPVRLSKDGGRTVGQTTLGIHVDQHALWWDPSNPDHIVVGNDGGIGVTWDGGGNWRFPNSIDVGQFYAISYNMDIPYRVCGGLQDNGTWCGPSRRRAGSITNDMWATVNGGDGFYADQDLTDPDVLWAESQGGNIARINTANGTREGLEKPDWREITKPARDELVLLEEAAGDDPTPAQAARIEELRARVAEDSAALQLRYNWNTPFVVSRHDPNTLYVGANRVLASTERGDGLAPISPDLSYADTMKIRVSTETTGGITRDVTGAEVYATIVALAESPRRAGWLFAGTDDGRLWRTTDDGGTWTELTDRFPGLPGGTYVSRIEPSHHEDGRFYVAFDGHRMDDFDPHVYVTDDDGASFREIGDGLPSGGPDFVHVIREDPLNENLLFVGTDVGVYLSTDRGETWARFMNGLPTVPVHDLRIQPREHELIAGTHGRSAWIVDIGALAQMAALEPSEEPILFDPAPGLQFGDPFVGGGSPGQGWFEGRSVRYGAEISYYVPRSVSTAIQQDVRERREAVADQGPAARAAIRAQSEIIILDAAGDTVQIVAGSVTPGLRSVYWNFERREEPDPLSPSERRDSLVAIRIVRGVADSLIALGSEEEMVENALETFLNRGSGRRAAFGGAGAPPRREFDERPGENYPNRPARAREEAEEPEEEEEGPPSSQGEVSRAFFAALRERGASINRGRFGEDEIVEPGRYTVVLRIGDREARTTIEILRAPGYAPRP